VRYQIFYITFTDSNNVEIRYSLRPMT